MTGTSTRNTIILSAERLFIERGRSATLEDIAAAAKVSKGGLLYHFSTKDSLRAAVCTEIVGRLWRAVGELVDETDTRPGALLRAYVRSLTGDSAEAARIFVPSSLPQLFSEAAAAQAVIRQDSEVWRRAFADDGIERGRSLVIRHSAEGAAAAAAEGYIDSVELQLIREELLSMIDPVHCHP